MLFMVPSQGREQRHTELAMERLGPCHWQQNPRTGSAEMRHHPSLAGCCSAEEGWGRSLSCHLYWGRHAQSTHSWLQWQLLFPPAQHWGGAWMKKICSSPKKKYLNWHHWPWGSYWQRWAQKEVMAWKSSGTTERNHFSKRHRNRFCFQLYTSKYNTADFDRVTQVSLWHDWQWNLASSL